MTLLDFYSIVLFPINKRNLLPIAFLAAWRRIYILNILGQLVSICLIPVGYSDHLPDIVTLSADFFFDYNTILYLEAPVIRVIFLMAR